MNAAHWHLVLNHLPILATIFGWTIFLYGWYRSEKAVLRVALAMIFFGGIMVLPVYYTGESAEEIVQGLSGVTHEDIEAHEEAANRSYYLGIVMAILALGGFIQRYRNGSISQWLVWLIIALGILTMGSFIQTANVGAKINHPELEITVPQNPTN
jgi:uncharacterized membrane protein